MHHGITEPQDAPGLLDKMAYLHVLNAEKEEPAYFLVSSKIGLKDKRRMLYFPMDFEELIIGGSIDTGLIQCDSRSGTKKIRFLTRLSLIKDGPAPRFQTMVGNRHK